jgi:hypothetical protein
MYLDQSSIVLRFVKVPLDPLETSSQNVQLLILV